MTRRTSRSVLLVMLALIGCGRPALAQPMVCHVIRPGDTVAQVAFRITGSAENRFQPWFQIADPGSSRFVPKASYDYIRPGWRACIVNQYVTRAASQPTRPWLSQIAPWLDGNVLLWIALVVLIALACHTVDGYVHDRQATIAVMEQFGSRFVREFERPLMQRGAAPHAVQSRLRARPGDARLDVLLAPALGHRYPNLSDHRRNVEYDIARVVQSLREESFVGGPPYGEGQWVVIPFHLTDGQMQAGGR